MPNYGKVRPGDAFNRSNAYSASWQNDVTELVNRPTGSGAPDTALKSSSGLVKVRNMVEVAEGEGDPEPVDLLRGHYVQLGAYLLAPNPDHAEIKHDFRKPWFEGKLYDEEMDNPIAILTRAARGGDGEEVLGDIETARVLGVCTAIVNVTDTDHWFAKPVDGEYVLESDSSGPVQLLARAASTGSQELSVMLGGGGGVTTEAALLKLTAELLARSDSTTPGTTSSYDVVKGSASGAIENWSAKDIPSGTYVGVIKISGGWVVWPAFC